MESKFKKFINDKDYGLLNSKQNLIDSLVELAEEIRIQNPSVELSNEQIMRTAMETKLRQMTESYQERLNDVSIQVLDILNSKFINKDKKTPSKEKDDKNGHEGKD